MVCAGTTRLVTQTDPIFRLSRVVLARGDVEARLFVFVDPSEGCDFPAAMPALFDPGRDSVCNRLTLVSSGFLLSVFHVGIVATRMLLSITIWLTCNIFVATVFFMARPKKKQTEAKSNTLRIRLSESERQAIDRAAASKSLETSTWARSELMALAKKIAAKE
jgi:hypothetical protein